MEIAILLFFLAIFAGILFLSALIWFVVRRIGRRRPTNRNFSNSASPGKKHISSGGDDDNIDFDDPTAVVYTDNLAFVDQSGQGSVAEDTADDEPCRSEDLHSQTSHSEYSAPPADAGNAESSSGYDSGSGYDSSSSSDSGSNSDSGSGSSSD